MAAYGFLPSDSNFSTRISTDGLDLRQWDSWIPDTPICLGPTHSQSAAAKLKKYLSRRGENPTREVGKILASLEKAKFGVCFSTKVGGCVWVTTNMLKAGDHLLTVGGHDEYGGAYRAFKWFVSESGVQTEFIDLVDVNVIHQRVKPNTKMLWIETPTNPLLTYVDIQAACEIAHQYKIIVVVDNTFLSPYFQKPLEFGADIVVHSLMNYKYVHSETYMGAAITNNKKIYRKLKVAQKVTAISPSPYDCYLVIRSLKCLQSHMEAQMRNSLEIAQFLEEHPLVSKVLHPALESHPGHQIAKKQTSGWGGMLAFYVKGGLEQSNALISHLKSFTMAESFEGYDCSIKIPSVMTHAYLPAEEKLKLGITDNLIRVSVGLLSAGVVIRDLRRAFELLKHGNQAATSCSIKKEG